MESPLHNTAAGNGPKYSILVPAYKDTFLAECIRSVLSQTFTGLELIIVDDGSPHDLQSIVRQFDDARIRYYRNEKGFGAKHVVGNWNKCLEYARGEYVICMGDDDLLKDTCLASYEKLMATCPGLDLYHARTAIIDEKGETVDLQEARPQRESVWSMIWHELKKERLQFIGDFLFRTAALRQNGGFYDLPWGTYSDNMTAYLCAREKGVANMQEVGFLYRSNPQTITSYHGNTADQLETLGKVRRRIEEFKASAVPQDETDRLYRHLILSDNKNRLENLKSYYIATGMGGNVFRLVYWLVRRKRYGLSVKNLAKAFAFWAAMRIK